MEKVNAIISYKAKVRQVIVDDAGTRADYIDFKKSITRRDCNLRPHQHAYYNSDMFPSMLNHAHKASTKGKEWCRLDDLPESVKVDTSGFLATVTIQVMI